MKVLSINVVYKNGSTGKIVDSLHNEIQKRGYDSIVCYGRGKTINEQGIYKVASESEAKFTALLAMLLGYQYKYSFLSTKKLINIIERENPDIIHLHCLNGYFINIYKLIDYLKKNKLPTVLTLHAEFMHTGNCGHAYDCEKWKNGCGNCLYFKEATRSLFFDKTNQQWEEMKKAFEGFRKLIVVSVSGWLMSRAKQSPILANHEHEVIFNGIDLTTFYPRESSNLVNKTPDRKIIVHTTAYFSDDINDIKGGYYVLKLAERLVTEKVTIVVVGKDKPNISYPPNVVHLDHINDQNKLAELYSLADVVLITSKRETFSMPCAESLCCGTPVVGFKAGGPESISLNQYSEFVEYGNIDELKAAIFRAMAKQMDVREITQTAHARFDQQLMCDQYIVLYNRLLKGEK